MDLSDHVFEVGEYVMGLEAIAPSGGGENGSLGFNHADDLDLSRAPVLIEKSVNVAMNEANYGDAKWGRRLRCLGECSG
jgi:hypothetical protein